jgi:hypothetical protein
MMESVMANGQRAEVTMMAETIENIRSSGSTSDGRMCADRRKCLRRQVNEIQESEQSTSDLIFWAPAICPMESPMIRNES